MLAPSSKAVTAPAELCGFDAFYATAGDEELDVTSGLCLLRLDYHREDFLCKPIGHVMMAHI
jgi:hypothetical protein